jgi:hypothetical protein
MQNHFFVRLIVPWFAVILFSCNAHEDQFIVYVSPEGNDQASGTMKDPLKSLPQAQQLLRSLKAEPGGETRGIRVFLREGVYPVEQTLMLSEEDSGTPDATVVIAAHHQEEVRLIGGQVVSGWKPLSNTQAMDRLPEDVHSNVYQVNLQEAGISDFGSIKPTGMGRELQPAPLELFFEGEPMNLARYPNTGKWLNIASVPQEGEELVNEGSERVKRFGVPVGRHYGKFAYTEDRPAQWKNDDIWLHGYWTHDWADSYVKVDSIDTMKKEFHLAEPHGVYGYTQNQKYYALNILEELDTAGEYYLDRKEGVLYFWPPKPLTNENAYVSVLEDRMIHLQDASHISIEGITLEGSRGDAVLIDGGSHNTIVACTVRNLGSQAITINGGEYNGVRGCTIYNVGDGGISISGGDRLTLKPGNNYAINNHVHDYSRINKTYRSAIKLNGVGNRLAHNYIHDAPHTGVLFSGNDHVLEYNEVHHIAKETGDVGAFYIGRDWTQRGNLVRYNYFHHLLGPGLHGVMAVYLDDAASGTHIHGNVFYKSGRSAFIGGGHDNIVENNVFVDCAPSVHLDARGKEWAADYIQPGGGWKMYEKLKAVSHDQPPYTESYPELAVILEQEDPAVPNGNIIRKNISYGGQWLNLTSKVDTARVTISENYVLQRIPDNINVEEGKFYPDPDVMDEIGFQKIPWDSIGLINNSF